MEQQTADARTAITGQLAVTARIYDRYPQHVEAICALVAEHVEQATAASWPDSYEAAASQLDQVLEALSRDPRLAEIRALLVAEYEPPPYTRPLRLPGDLKTHGEPVTAGVAILAIAAGAAAGALFGAVLPL